MSKGKVGRFIGVVACAVAALGLATAAEAQQKKRVEFAGLKKDGFLIQSLNLDGKPVVVVGGNDEASTMYAAYELLERLGVVFQLTNDIIPERKPDLMIPTINVRMEPAMKYRGLHLRHFVRLRFRLYNARRLSVVRKRVPAGPKYLLTRHWLPESDLRQACWVVY